MIPDMDGYAACEYIKRDSRLCGVLVVFVSHTNDPSQKMWGFKVGGVDYITKPFHDVKVSTHMRTHIMNE